MRKRKLWRSIVAGAVIGLVEAAGLDASRRVVRRPLRAIRLDDREPADLLAGAGVWFLDPIGDPRPERADVRRPVLERLRLTRLAPGALLRAAGRGRS